MRGFCGQFYHQFLFHSGRKLCLRQKKDRSQRKREIKIWLPGTCRSTHLNYSGDIFCSHCIFFIVKKINKSCEQRWDDSFKGRLQFGRSSLSHLQMTASPIPTLKKQWCSMKCWIKQAAVSSARISSNVRPNGERSFFFSLADADV